MLFQIKPRCTLQGSAITSKEVTVTRTVVCALQRISLPLGALASKHAEKENTILEWHAARWQRCCPRSVNAICRCTVYSTAEASAEAQRHRGTHFKESRKPLAASH